MKRKNPLIKRLQKYDPTVRKVVDASEPIQIEVTRADEKKSIKLDPTHCAMAVACQRVLQPHSVIASRSFLYIVKGGTATRYALPGSVQHEIVSFDRGGGFEAGEYHARPVSPSNRLGVGRPGGLRRQRNPESSRGKAHVTKNIRPILGAKR